jgi:DNA-binding MarR family transcriptional regulator
MTAERRQKNKAEPVSKQKLRLWLRLLGASRAVEVELRKRLREDFGETLPRFDVMAALARKGAGMTMTELSRFLMVSNGNVTGIIDRLVAEGIVVRLAHKEDRRAIFVRLTPKGAQQFQVMAKAHEAWVAEILANVASAETEILIELLSNLVLDGVRPPRDGARPSGTGGYRRNQQSVRV